jgi:hypothetical protein
MKCPYCNHTFPLTWGRYLKAGTGKHTCPQCLKPARLKFRASTFLILLIVCLVASIPGAIAAHHWLGPPFSALGVIPTLALLLPLDKLFDAKYRELRAIKGEASSSETAACAECDGVFKIEEMIAHKDLHVCARCKPIFLQKLAEGARISRPAGDESNRQS